MCRSLIARVAGVERTSQLQTLHWTTEYSEFNSTAADNLWKELRPAFGLVALDHDWASKHGLPRSQDLQGDRSKGIYMIDAYHQMHCLEVVRGVPQSTPFEHKFHCLDSLRQSVMCRADDTPLYTLGDFRSGDGQLRSCRDWKLLSRWASERFPFSSSE
ncbi:cytochrome p450 protein [Rutstroemia sp. NJR-2017a BBW]|nr:cytochrome p450 protein [Rutstroemia sp. NJR-2017a BBW]